MTPEQFEIIFKDQMLKCENTMLKKAEEYAPIDRLSNFKIAAYLQNTTPMNALGGMMAKHVVSIFELIREEKDVDIEVWEEKIGDALNYLFLLKAIVVDQSLNNQNKKESKNA